MSKLSAVIIAKNSEKIIQNCLKSVRFADEILVVDAGSVDKTVELSKSFGAKVIKVEPTDFSALRDIGMKHAKEEWILYVDTDEEVSDKLAQNIKKTIAESSNGIAAFKLKRKNFYYGNYEWPFIEHLERLFLKKSLHGWYGKLHESPKIEGMVEELEGYIFHYTHADLFAMVEKTNQWSQVEAKLRFEQKHPKMSWWRFFRVMVTGFFDSYVKQKGYRAGTVGVVESLYQSYSLFVTYAKLWEMQEKNEA